MTPTLEAQLIRSLEALVTKNEQTLRDQAEARLASRLPALRCSCESMYSGPGCLPCITKRARRVLDEVKAAREPDALAANIPPCGDCGKDAADTATLRFDAEGNVTAQCRACYEAMREREMAAVGS